MSKNFFGYYDIPVQGTDFPIAVKANYSWTDELPATRLDPACGGVELNQVSLCIDQHYKPIDQLEVDGDWIDELIRDIRDMEIS